MRMLFLDDDITRTQKIRLLNDKYRVIGVETVYQAISQLEESEFDVISLDHDLDGLVFYPSDEKSGAEVTRWIAKNRPHITSKIILHSWNESGVTTMKNILAHADIKCVTLKFDTLEYWNFLCLN